MEGSEIFPMLSFEHISGVLNRQVKFDIWQRIADESFMKVVCRGNELRMI